MDNPILPPPIRAWFDIQANFREVEVWLRDTSKRLALKWTELDFTNSSLANILTRPHSALQSTDAAGSHPAAAISNVPAGSIAATTVQAAINELDTEKTNNSHDHSGGDGAQINHTTLSNIGTKTHAQIDTHIGLEPIEAHGALAYGNMYLGSPITITIGVSGAWYEVDTGATDFTAGELNDVTFSDHYLTVSKTGKYLIIFDVAADSGTNDELSLAVMKNGTVPANGGHGHSTVVIAGRSIQISSSTILSLAANDQISLAVQNHSAATNIILDYANVSVVQVG